jgi:hypothetical protein
MPVRLGLVLTSARADNPFCSAAFCSPRFCGRGFTLAGFALPRRHRSATRPALGSDHECVGDQFLRCPLSLFHFPDLVLAWTDLEVCPGWYGRRSRAWVARFDTDAVGKPSPRTLLHSEPVASPARHAGNRSTSCLRLVAHDASQRFRRPTLVFVGVRDPTFCRSRCRLDRLLFRLRHRSTYSNHAP